MSGDIKAMILTVGGSPLPLIESLKHFKPQLVYFLASNDSLDKIPEIKTGVKNESDYVYRDVKIVVDDINNVTHCYQKALECCVGIEEAGIPPQSILGDFTGGTKVMSAALTLAAIAKGFELTYTGGTLREKDGLGVVTNGSEQIFQQVNPWQALSLAERQKAAQLFNRFQFEGAASLFKSALEKNRHPALKHYLTALTHVSEGYMEWDKFHHETAFHYLQRGFNELTVYFDCTQDVSGAELVKEISGNLQFLESFSRASRKFSILSNFHVQDLISNARRRAIEGKYDDAVARLYRTLEMIAQERLKTKYNFDADKIPIENELVIKALLHLDPQFKEKHIRRDSNCLELSLYAAYEFLNAMEDELAAQYFTHENENGQILAARNNSILAHGTRVLEKSDFEKILKLIVGFSGVDEKDLPVFPEINVPYV